MQNMKHGAEISASLSEYEVCDVTPELQPEKYDQGNLLVGLFASSVKLSPVKMTGCARTMILFSWFDHLAESFSYKEVQF